MDFSSLSMSSLLAPTRKAKKSLDLSAWEERIRVLGASHYVIRAWQKMHGRHGLAWQACGSDGFRDPYRVWLSEIMLQQTRVAAVVDYFDRFTTRFPTIFDLAESTEDEVYSQWSGLGYYRRARFLHACAKIVVDRYDGSFPNNVALLEELPGIGKTTAAAIASFCFGAKVSIFDGNVARLTSRLFAFQGDLSSQKQREALWLLAETLLPDTAAGMPWHTQGLMDLGATICKPKKPLCDQCPLAQVCAAKKQGLSLEAFPVKTKKIKRGAQDSVWLWLELDDRVWLEPRPSAGVWGGLWSLPLLDADAARSFIDRHALLALVGRPFKHVLTHRDWTFHPVAAQVGPEEAEAIAQDPMLGPGRWFGKNEWMDLGLSGPTKTKLTCWQVDGSKNLLQTAP